MFRNEETRCVVDGVTWPTTNTEQLRLGLGPRTDVGDIAVAIAINLARTHHHVATSTSKRVKHTAEWNPSFDKLLGSANWQITRDIKRFSVADHEIRFECGPSNAGAEHLHDAHARCKNFSVAAPCFSARNSNDISECY